MRQYTTQDQTAKLIELGFEKPKMAAPALKWVDGEPTFEPQYTIGELIEMLQKQVYQIEYSGIPCDLNIHYDGGTWLIVYLCERDGRFKTERLDLIDALYDMILKLKEKGVI